MFGRKRHILRSTYDEFLLDAIDDAKMIWDHARQTEKSVYDADEELTAETKLARAKYEFLYREAKLRKVHGHMQSSVFGK